MPAPRVTSEFLCPRRGKGKPMQGEVEEMTVEEGHAEDAANLTMEEKAKDRLCRRNLPKERKGRSFKKEIGTVRKGSYARQSQG